MTGQNTRYIVIQKRNINNIESIVICFVINFSILDIISLDIRNFTFKTHIMKPFIKHTYIMNNLTFDQ